jgi:hypothetical protein
MHRSGKGKSEALVLVFAEWKPIVEVGRIIEGLFGEPLDLPQDGSLTLRKGEPNPKYRLLAMLARDGLRAERNGYRPREALEAFDRGPVAAARTLGEYVRIFRKPLDANIFRWAHWLMRRLSPKNTGRVAFADDLGKILAAAVFERIYRTVEDPRQAKYLSGASPDLQAMLKPDRAAALLTYWWTGVMKNERHIDAPWTYLASIAPGQCLFGDEDVEPRSEEESPEDSDPIAAWERKKVEKLLAECVKGYGMKDILEEFERSPRRDKSRPVEEQLLRVLGHGGALLYRHFKATDQEGRSAEP